jgi:hypothetical protein
MMRMIRMSLDEKLIWYIKEITERYGWTPQEILSLSISEMQVMVMTINNPALWD